MKWPWSTPASDDLVERKEPNPDCQHLQSKVYSGCRIGYAFCPQCQAEVHLTDVFNNLLAAMRKKIKE